MKLDFKEIANAWYNTLIHTEAEKELADKRFDICSTCPSKQNILSKKKGLGFKCLECGCPLAAKVYTKKTYLSRGGSCPLDKWKQVELEYSIKYNNVDNIKLNKTLL